MAATDNKDESLNFKDILARFKNEERVKLSRVESGYIKRKKRELLEVETDKINQNQIDEDNNNAKKKESILNGVKTERNSVMEFYSSGHDGDKFNEDDDATAINKMKAANSEHGDSKNQERKNVSTPFSLIKDEKRKDEQLEDKMIPVEKFKASPKLGENMPKEKSLEDKNPSPFDNISRLEKPAVKNIVDSNNSSSRNQNVPNYGKPDKSKSKKIRTFSDNNSNKNQNIAAQIIYTDIDVSKSENPDGTSGNKKMETVLEITESSDEENSKTKIKSDNNNFTAIQIQSDAKSNSEENGGYEPIGSPKLRDERNNNNQSRENVDENLRNNNNNLRNVNRDEEKITIEDEENEIGKKFEDSFSPPESKTSALTNEKSGEANGNEQGGKDSKLEVKEEKTATEKLAEGKLDQKMLKDSKSFSLEETNIRNNKENNQRGEGGGKPKSEHHLAEGLSRKSDQISVNLELEEEEKKEKSEQKRKRASSSKDGKKSRASSRDSCTSTGHSKSVTPNTDFSYNVITEGKKSHKIRGKVLKTTSAQSPFVERRMSVKVSAIKEKVEGTLRRNKNKEKYKKHENLSASSRNSSRTTNISQSSKQTKRSKSSNKTGRKSHSKNISSSKHQKLIEEDQGEQPILSKRTKVVLVLWTAVGLVLWIVLFFIMKMNYVL